MAEDNRGGESAAAEVIAPYAERAASALVGVVTDTDVVKRAINKMNPALVAGIHHIAPGLGGLLVGKFVPDTLFKNSEAADVAKNFIIHVVKKAADAFEQGADITTEEFADELMDDMSELTVKVALGMIHDKDCATLATAGLRRNMIADTPILNAIDQGLPAAPCCLAVLKQRLEKPAQTTAKRNRPPKSALDVLGMVDEEKRQEFNDWLNGLTAEQRAHALAGLNELDSVEELEGFMALDESLRLEMLPLLENRGLAVSAKQGLRFIADSAGQLLNDTWDEAKINADAALQPAADSIEQAATRFQQQLAPAVTPPTSRLAKAGRAIKSLFWLMVGSVFPIGSREEA